MANIVVTKSGNSMEVEFNVYGADPRINSKCRGYDIRDIVETDLIYDESSISLTMRDAHGQRTWPLTWLSSYTGTDYFIVDSVENIAPTSQKDLFDKLQALR